MPTINQTAINLILDTYWKTLSSKPTRPENLNDFQVPNFMMSLCRGGIYRRSISPQSRAAYNTLSDLVTYGEAETVALQDLLEIMGSLNFESTMMVIIYAQLKLVYKQRLEGCQTLENIVRSGHTLGFGQGRYSNLYSALRAQPASPAAGNSTIDPSSTSAQPASPAAGNSTIDPSSTSAQTASRAAGNSTIDRTIDTSSTSAQPASCAAGNRTIDRTIDSSATFAMCLAKEIGCRIEYNTKFDLHHMYALSTAQLQTIFNGPLQVAKPKKPYDDSKDPHSLPEMARIQCEGDKPKEQQLRRTKSCDV